MSMYSVMFNISITDIHILLCRYDYNWITGKKVTPEFIHILYNGGVNLIEFIDSMNCTRKCAFNLMPTIKLGGTER